MSYKRTYKKVKNKQTIFHVTFTLPLFCSLDEAENMSISVQEGDLIVMATDGLFDNLSNEQILREVAQLEVMAKHQEKASCAVR